MPIWVFGFISSFSATAIYDIWLYQLYNVMFTALPIMWFAIFDWEHDKEKFLTQPKLYRIGLDNVFFNKFIFWRWFFYAVWQGMFLLAISLICEDTLDE